MSLRWSSLQSCAVVNYGKMGLGIDPVGLLYPIFYTLFVPSPSVLMLVTAASAESQRIFQLRAGRRPAKTTCVAGMWNCVAIRRAWRDIHKVQPHSRPV